MKTFLPAVLLAAMLAACGGSDSVAPGCTPGTADCDSTGTVTTGWVTKSMSVGGATYAYKVFVPANYNSVSSVPVILFMHGSGEKGTDNVKQTQVGLGPVVTAQAATFPAIVVFPQTPLGEGADPDPLATTAMAQTLAEYTKSDTKRLYLTGLSFGGVHSFDLAYRSPTQWAAYVPIAATICPTCVTGTATTTFAQALQLVPPALKNLPTWQFQGELDPSISTAQVRQIDSAFVSLGANYKYTEYAGAGHEIWDTVYGTAAMWSWLWAQKRP